MEKKICNICKLEKNIEDFTKYGKGGKYRRLMCKFCINKDYRENKYPINKERILNHNKKWQKTEKGKEYARFKYIWQHYKMKKEEWLQMLENQKNRCLICNIYSDRLGFFHTDHCHITNKVRGLLCKNCNTVLGHAKDNITILQKAINYLRK